jgi:hypothetical protein
MYKLDPAKANGTWLIEFEVGDPVLVYVIPFLKLTPLDPILFVEF